MVEASAFAKLAELYVESMGRTQGRDLVGRVRPSGALQLGFIGNVPVDIDGDGHVA